MTASGGRNPARYRALLPTYTPSPHSAPEPVPKRKVTHTACKECHEKKRKCDGHKPECAPCKRGGQHCTWPIPSSSSANEALSLELETLRGRYDVLESFVTKLRVAPHQGALEALHQFRSSTSGWPAELDTPASRPEASSSTSAANGLNSPPSEPDPVACTSPPVVSGLAHDHASPGQDSYHMHLAEPDQRHCAQDRGPASPLDTTLAAVKGASDPRLEGLDISFWTAVPVTDMFAAHAISSYLASDHGIWELFDDGPFLSDLVSQKSEFCSPFLVNCLLAFASQTYAMHCPSATGRGLQFEEAAEILWKTDATRLDSETALTGFTLLYLCFAARWECDSADDCLRQVFNMAVRMKLFGVDERISDFDMSFLKADRRSSMIHAAWAAFNIISMHRKRLLGNVLLLPPLVASPSMASSATGVSEDKDLSPDAVVEIDTET